MWKSSSNTPPLIDKILLKFFADVLYAKRLLCVEELEAIYDVKTLSDLDIIFERMLGGEFNVYKRGESYNRIESRGSAGVNGDNITANQDATVRSSVHDRAVYVEQACTTP